MVQLTGELDASTKAETFAACCNCIGADIVLDLGDLTFMDSGGYLTIVAAARVLESEGRTLTIIGLSGGPLRIATLLGWPQLGRAVRPWRMPHNMTDAALGEVFPEPAPATEPYRR
jgi:anti-anti-sigma factor